MKKEREIGKEGRKEGSREEGEEYEPYSLQSRLSVYVRVMARLHAQVSETRTVLWPGLA